jgi:hypothetical protein
MPGAISLSSPTHFPIISGLVKVKPVMLPPGCDRLFAKPWPTGSFTRAKTIGMDLVIFFSASITGELFGEDHVGRERDQFLGILANEFDLAVRPPVFDMDVLAVLPAEVRESLPECRVCAPGCRGRLCGPASALRPWASRLPVEHAPRAAKWPLCYRARR